MYEGTGYRVLAQAALQCPFSQSHTVAKQNGAASFPVRFSCSFYGVEMKYQAITHMPRVPLRNMKHVA